MSSMQWLAWKLSTKYCVRILDTMTPGVEYVTFKSDCFYQTTLQVNPTNLSWFYCFCNDRDYCNASTTSFTFLLPVILVLRYFCF
ncbi:hypothetical protein ANCCAN_02883 [Ancylostoma caninum]|uniref:Protein quiver n=1 Tax=Ancylostoma caninum TaxID=29170 RepID=A0A368H3D8_ANCCA|nr:hypothetical protein ANCCAN_02883 [Ancylostoma caninum]